jgi:hypothetical protein
VIVAAVAAVIVIVSAGGSNATAVQASAPSATPGAAAGAASPAAKSVSLALAKITPKASFYAMDSGGTQVKFFVLKASDGKIRNAFDACQVCYANKKGYYQDGDQIVCNNCGRRFPSALIGVQRGGCNPVPFQSTVAGSDLVMSASALQAGVPLFQ